MAGELTRELSTTVLQHIQYLMLANSAGTSFQQRNTSSDAKFAALHVHVHGMQGNSNIIQDALMLPHMAKCNRTTLHYVIRTDH